VTWVNRKLVLVNLEIVLILALDSSIVWNEFIIGLEIILGTSMELRGDLGQIEAYFGLFGDSANLDAR
jgi:hypothetical protein